MAQNIKQGNIFGRLGTGIGQGLAEQIPKEIDRNRLSSGLRDFEQSHQDLSPMQQIARLSSIPGITPQMIQTFGELAQRQNLSNAYRRSGSQERATGSAPRNNLPSSPSLQDVKFGQKEQNIRSVAPEERGSPRDYNLQQSEEMSRIQTERRPIQSQRTPPVDRESSPLQGDPEINPLSPELQPRSPWSSNERDQRVSEYINMGFTPQEARQLQSDDEARNLAEPGVDQQRQQYIKGVRESLNENLNKAIEERLQKTSPEIFGDLTGDMKKNIERAAYRDLIKRKNATEKDIIEDWSKRAFEAAKTKGKFQNLSSTTGIIDAMKDAATGNDNVFKKLKEFSKTFREANNTDEFYELLRSEMKMSPHGAASIAFDRSDKVKEAIKNYKLSAPRYALGGELPPRPADTVKEARRIAIEIENAITPNDSLLAIAQDLAEKDPSFNANAFFDQISEDRDNLGLTQRQKDELSVRQKEDLLPYWGDFLVLPWIRRR